MRMQRLLLSTLLALCLPFSGWTGEFTVKRVTPVGPVYGVMVWPAKWSPSGAKLAYASENGIYLSDTIGKSLMSRSIDGYPHSFEWLSDEELVVRGKNVDSSGTRHYFIKRISLNTNQSVTIFQSELRAGELDPRPEGLRIFGPYQSAEGAVYYETIRPDGNRQTNLVMPNTAESSNLYRSPDSLHFFRATRDGVYRVNVGSGERKLFSKYITASDGYEPARVDKSGSYLFVGGKLIIIDMDSVVKPSALAGVRPAGTVGCGFVWGSFHPTKPYLLGVITCDDGEGKLVIDRMALVNCINYQVTFLEPLLGVSGCTAPLFSPDGRHLLFSSLGTLYVAEMGE